MSNTFEAGKTYKLSDKAIAFITGAAQAVFKGEEGVFKVELVDALGAFSDDVTSPLTTDRFNIPHFMVADCTEVTDAS